MSDEGHHVERANALEKLDCLYGAQAQIVRHAATLILAQLEGDIASRGAEALTDFDPPLEGAAAGGLRKGEGATLSAIGSSWMGAISSLYDSERARALHGDGEVVEVIHPAEVSAAFADRLPILVYDYILKQAPGLASYFRPDLRGHSARKRRSYEVTIDFASGNVAANFGTLQAGKLAPSVRLIKNRLWDLRVDRDRAAMFNRKYELLVQVPNFGDPQFSDLQLRNVEEARRELEQQADQEELRLTTFSSVEDIGNRILEIQLV
ncbi:hypothetical protein [Sphingomonas sp. 3-13AW]|uniref:hypothetical protein n=1 Tax=Sphingomonas sp. 3-13AW TaxID=3050450 RepID=UPI003BB61116